MVVRVVDSEDGGKVKVVIDLVRHAESKWVELARKSDVPRFGGRMDEIDLSETGKIQSGQLRLYADRNGINPTAFCSSTAYRARRTHRFAFGQHRPLHLDARLDELDWGKWTEGPRAIAETRPFVRARFRDGLNFTPPGGESYASVGRRVREAIKEKAHEMGGGHLWAYTHKNAIVGAVCPFLRWSWEQAWTANVGVVSLTRFTYDGEHLRLVFFNELTLG